jgi:hypothetical protein
LRGALFVALGIRVNMTQKVRIESPGEAFLVWAASTAIVAFVIFNTFEFHHAYALLVLIGFALLGIIPGCIHASRIRRRLRK